MVSENSLDVAIIGMNGRFPGSNNLEEYWSNIKNGVESITYFSDEELQDNGVSLELLQNEKFVKAGALLDDIDCFDASFFGYGRREAELLDPQQRIFLESCWHALEHAGCDPNQYKGAIGVYGGMGFNSYYYNNLRTNPDKVASLGEFQTYLGNEKDFLTTRVSYKLNLTGPSVTVQTACSTSLVAVHNATNSLLNGECDIALAGGVSIRSNQKTGYLYEEDGILSPDGHCRPFDELGRGTVFGSGVGVVVLKRLTDAIKDGDEIHAVIKGSAVNNDGGMKVGYSAPSVNGQAQVIIEALQLSEMEADHISYVEAHGTATAIGDPIELEALKLAYSLTTNKKQYCAVGSVKGNIGHLDAAAGVASLIKTVLAIKHKQLPPTVNFKSPNPKFDFENSPFYIIDSLKDWKSPNKRRAAVSSFGIGGTNAHLIIEEPDVNQSRASSEKSEERIISLSAKTEEGLKKIKQNLSAYLNKNESKLNLEDLAYTLHLGRQSFKHRTAFVAKNIKEVIEVLEKEEDSKSSSGKSTLNPPRNVFMFPGQGAQYVNMGKNLYENEPVFKKEVDYCADILSAYIGFDIRTVMYPLDQDKTSANEILRQTKITQPALFIIEYAIARLLISKGIEPEAMVGHSVGEYVAACLAGVFTLEDGLRLIAFRGSLMQSVRPGTMLAVPLSEIEVKGMIDEDVSLACQNSPKSMILSGTKEKIHKISERYKEQGVYTTPLNTSHAFHSVMMDSILDEFKRVVSEVNLQVPQIPYQSNLTGTWVTKEQATSPDYWVSHLRGTVRFSDSLQEIIIEDSVLLEAGPGRTLANLARQHGVNENRLVSTMKNIYEKESDIFYFKQALCNLWANGININWNFLYEGEMRKKIELPLYPFEKNKYWINENTNSNTQPQTKELQKSKIKDWFYAPTWKQMHQQINLNKGINSLLVLADKSGLYKYLIREWLNDGIESIVIHKGDIYQKQGEKEYTINPDSPLDYKKLLGNLNEDGISPDLIVYMWALDGKQNNNTNFDSYEETIKNNFSSLIYFTQVLNERKMSIDFVILTNNLFSVSGNEMIRPEQALITGPLIVIPQEHPEISCYGIDIDDEMLNNLRSDYLKKYLAKDIISKKTHKIIARRGRYRWTREYEQIHGDDDSSKDFGLKIKGTYIITGGLGGIGLALAEDLVEKCQANIVLIGRTGLPDRATWTQQLNENMGYADKIKRILNMESKGSKVLIFSADVSNIHQMRQVAQEISTVFVDVNGIFHTAGIPGDGLIQRKTIEQAEKVLSPKVKGTLVLSEVFKEQNLDFMVLFSSTVAIHGGFGQVDYCSANAFLDAFSFYNYNQNQMPTYSINWNQWKWDAWQTKELSERATPLQKAQIEARQEFGMNFSEGFEAMERVLQMEGPVVSVSSLNLQEVINQHNQLSALQMLDKIGESNKDLESFSRGELNSVFVEPKNETEKYLCRIWEEIFGLSPIGILDDFFELGGHSLMAIQLFSRIRKKYNIELPMNKIFECPTISELSEAISEALIANIDDDELEMLLNEIELL